MDLAQDLRAFLIKLILLKSSLSIFKKLILHLCRKLIFLMSATAKPINFLFFLHSLIAYS